MTKEDINVLIDMQLVREICAEGYRARQKAGIPIRQPLQTLFISSNWLTKRRAEIKKKVLEKLSTF